ncbi:ADP-ribosylation factor GTPase-activating protein glo3 [Sphaceloma murrayae]|uniref:ADP-ribosylation factor GTPase-activating protein glo3 n=1 Tax=Sphaceloma murrayae TaxID=2082308 RepID=A0A2K1QY26_9PEZI|nr:ADP-ribosylation factor GTPase-activating protein glo3 [Sphaceloma murrayae]
MPQPRLIDPAVFFDIVKIRRSIDEATEEAVRANSGVSNVGNVSRFDPFGGSQQPASQMSRERIHRVRQKAVKLLAKAYTLDEVATSVVTMSSSSSLEDVAEHVLKRDKEDIDAKYVHFFHEKIPSRAMEEHTSLQPLVEIMQKLTWDAQAAPHRTRGLVRIMKGDHEGAAEDFTIALQAAEELKKKHKPSTDQLVLARDFKRAREQWERNPRSIPQLKDDEQPTTMEQQLLFNRAGVYLTLACNSVHVSLQGLHEYLKKTTPDPETGVVQELTPKEIAEHQKRLDARKRVKTLAKRAWKDYMAFLAFFDYSPGYPVDVTDEIMKRVHEIAGGRQHLHSHGNDSQQTLTSLRNDALAKSNKPQGVDLSNIAPPKVYPADALFASQPLSDLPPFPSDNTTSGSTPLLGVRETLTYHPLLPDALHSLLLTHCLLQTSPTELNRHAHSAARLARIADGYPIFQPPRSPSRADWIEVLRQTGNWIKLSSSWGDLCRPAHEGAPNSRKGSGNGNAGVNGSNGALVTNKGPGEMAEVGETPEEKKERIKRQAIADALGDERVVDEETFAKSVRARERRAERDEERDRVLFRSENGNTLENGAAGGSKGQAGSGAGAEATKTKADEEAEEKLKKWAEEESLKEYPVTTERVEAIARWVREAPAQMPGTGKKKRRPAGKKRRGLVESVEGMKIEEGKGAEEVD